MKLLVSTLIAAQVDSMTDHVWRKLVERASDMTVYLLKHSSCKLDSWQLILFQLFDLSYPVQRRVSLVYVTRATKCDMSSSYLGLLAAAMLDAPDMNASAGSMAISGHAPMSNQIVTMRGSAW